MQIKKIISKPKEINVELTKKIEDMLDNGGSIIYVIEDIIKFDNKDIYDIIDSVPDYMIEMIKKELAKRNYYIAREEFPELNNMELEDDVF